MSVPHLATGEIIAARGPKNAVDPFRPYAFLVEPERAASGRIEDVATIFLTNRECPFHCLMCDLWKNTTDETVPAGAIPAQIDFALARLPPARQLKLYNSGNFFDRRAIPPEDHGAIVERCRGFETVIIENHPRMCGDECVRFRDRLGTRLEVAIGLETVHPELLPALNKQMTLDDFDRAVRFLTQHDIGVRAFVLVRPPFLSEDEGVDWAVRSAQHAFATGVECCVLIPVRGGNGIMEQLGQRGAFSPPSLQSLERAMDRALELPERGVRRLFVDFWDIERLAACPRCSTQRVERLRVMNRTQTVEPPIICDCAGPACQVRPA